MPRFWDLKNWLDHVPPRKITVIQLMWPDHVKYQAQHCNQKMTRDRQILHELISECTLLKGLKRDPSFRIPAEDEFTIGVIEMLASRRIPTWLVVAAQIMCDIRYVLEEGAEHCHTELLQMGARVTNILSSYLEYAAEHGRIHSIIQITAAEAKCW